MAKRKLLVSGKLEHKFECRMRLSPRIALYLLAFQFQVFQLC
jgi:hypothetical protein